MKRVLLISLLLYSLFPFLLFSQNRDRVSIHQETSVLAKGSKSIYKSDIYYNILNDNLLVHHLYPAEFIKISNRLGEAKLYFPSTNTVRIQQSAALSSTNDLLYYFVHNRISDLGLVKEGFKLVSSTTENTRNITVWQAPESLKLVYQVRLIFENLLPVYAEYTDIKGFILKKIYYGRYADFTTFNLPLRITEISYEGSRDSVIRLSQFSQIKTGDFKDETYFEFKIPENASISK